MSKKAELIQSHFPTIYLTVISLLQGIALSQLIPILIAFFGMAEHPWMDIHMLPLMLMLLIIFIVWHHYAVGIFFLRWFPNIIDTIIPFMISIGQFFLISFVTIKTSVSDIDVDSFTKGFALFFVLGSFTYFAAAWRTDPDLFTNLMSKPNAVIHCQLVRKYFNIAGWSVLFQGLFALLIFVLGNQQLLWITLIFFIAHISLTEYFLLRKIRPHFDRAVDEEG
jgi:hypothetical protein